MKRQELILSAVLRDHSTDTMHKSIGRDLDTLRSRLKHEGESFLFLTHPAMHDALMESIAHGRWIRSRLWREHGQGGPVYLRAYLDLVFDFRHGGVVRDTAEAASALRVVRQYLLMFGKVRVLPHPNKVERALTDFIATDLELRQNRSVILAALADPLLKEVVDCIVTPLIRKVNANLGSFYPKHGKGATADGARYGRKYRVLRSSYTRRADKVFPYDEFAFANPSHWASEDSLYRQFVRPADELPMKVVAVPKTQKSPRLIAEEPVSQQFLQQMLHAALLDGVKDDALADICDWSDQERNRDLSRLASQGGLATLDLSEASDRVHVAVVNLLFQGCPSFREAVLACRSTRCDVSGEVIRLEKFAPMGSAMCFPVETLFFTALCVRAMCETDGALLTAVLRRNRKVAISRLRGRLSVYGDDIVITQDASQLAITQLEAVGLKVNRRKSFLTGNFRESCGADWFNGHDVTIVRAREPLPRSSNDHRSLQSWCTVQNSMYREGHTESARTLEALIKPFGLETYGGTPAFMSLALSYSLLLSDDVDKTSFSMCDDLHAPRVKAHKAKYDVREVQSDGYDQLHHWFLGTADRRETRPAEREVAFNYDRPPELVSLRKRSVRLF